MLMRYFAKYRNGKPVGFERQEMKPDADWVEIDIKEAVRIAPMFKGWVVMAIHEIDRHALAGDGWSHFVWYATPEQRERAAINHSGQTLEQLSEGGGLRWEEIFAILTVNPWRRLILMRAFTCCRDWPKSVVA